MAKQKAFESSKVLKKAIEKWLSALICDLLKVLLLFF